MSAFTAEAFQNEFLPRDGTEVDAIVTVACEGAPEGTAAGLGVAEIVIVDTSGSMSVPRVKIRAARDATSVALDCIRDGVSFGVIAGAEFARQVYPAKGGLAVMSDATRAAAKKEIVRLEGDGGTAIGGWLMLAKELFETVAPGVRHAILLTDGENQDESPEDLGRAIAACEGVFQCDCRGVGTDWVVGELRRISTALLGTVDIIAEPQAMVADFRALIEGAMGKATSTVALRLWTPQGATVRAVRQVAPTIEVLTDRGVRVDALTVEYPTGAWGREARDYHVEVRVAARGIGDEMLAGRVGLVVDGEVAAQALIRAVWTEDERLSTQINREVAHYTGLRRPDDPDDPAGTGVREPRRPTPPRRTGAIQLPRPDNTT